ncbi:hypothetical protein OIU92_00045 [Escherichia coli]|nr:hypothetical protein [Escherichia coli]
MSLSFSARIFLTGCRVQQTANGSGQLFQVHGKPPSFSRPRVSFIWRRVFANLFRFRRAVQAVAARNGGESSLLAKEAQGKWPQRHRRDACGHRYLVLAGIVNDTGNTAPGNWNGPGGH